MGSAEVPSPSKGFAKLQSGFSHNDTPAPSKSFLGLSGSGQNTERSSLKQGNRYYGSSNLPSDCGNDSGHKEDQTPVSANTLNLDLNIPVDACNNCSSSSIEKHSDSKQIETGGLRKKMEPSPSLELAGTSTERRDPRLGKCMLQKSVYDFELGNLSSASSGQNNFEVSLDLQLKPPRKPEPRFNWSDFSPAEEDSDTERISLGLSLLGSCIEPELHDTGILKNKDIEFDMWNLSGALHVKSERCQGDGSLKTAGPSNLLSDCFGSTKSVSPYGQAHGHPKGTGEVSPPKVVKASIMEVPQRSCGSKVKKIYNDFETSCGSKVKDIYNHHPNPSMHRGIDLNIPLSDWDDSSQATTNSSKPTLAELAWEFVAQDHDESHQDELPSSSLLKKMDEIVANSSILIPKPMGLEPKEPNTATNVIESDESGSVAYQGNKPGIPDVLSGDHSKMVTLNCNGSISSKVSSDEVPMELDGKSSVADSGEEIEEFEEVLDEVSDEEIEEYEEILEEVSGEGSEEFEEGVEVSCDDESDGSHHAEGDENTDVEEFEEVVEEVACDVESDRSPHGEDAENIEPESDSPCSEDGDGEVGEQREDNALHGIDSVNSVTVTVPTTMPSQEVVREKHVENAKVCVEKRKLDATVLENLQPALDAWTTTRKRPLATEVGNTKQGWGSWVNIAEAPEEGNMKQGRGSWGTIAEVTEGSTKQGWGTWETKSGPKDTVEVTGRGSYEVSRRQNTRRFHSATHGDARKHEVPWVKGGRIIKFKKTGSERSSYEEKPNHARATPSQIERDGRDRFPGKSFKHHKSHPRGHRDDRRNKRFHRPDNNRPNQFGMQRSDYTWVRKENDFSHCDQKFPKTKTADDGADVALSSQRQAREGETQPVGLMNQTVRNVSPSPSGGYIRRDIPDFETPVSNERRVVRRDFPGSIVDHLQQYAQPESPQKRRSDWPVIQNINTERRVVRRDFPASRVGHLQQYAQAEGPQKRRTDSPVIQNIGTDPRSFSSSLRPFKHHSQPCLRSPQTSVHAGMQFSRERVHCLPNLIAPWDEATTDDAREITPQYTMPVTSMRRNSGLRRFNVHPQQIQEESFSRSQYYHEGDQTEDAGSLDERHIGVHNGPLRPPAYPKTRRRLGNASNNEQTMDAELFDEMNYSVENDLRPVHYCQELNEDFQERANTRKHRGNVRDRSVGNPNEGRRMHGQAGNYRFHGRKAWHDPEFSDADLKRRY